MRIAIVTKGYKGLNDEVSDELARSPTVTLIDIIKEKQNYCLVEVIKNKAGSFTHGAGPIFTNLMVEKGVELVVGPALGMGVQELFNEKKIKFMKCIPGTKVKDIINKILQDIRKNNLIIKNLIN